MSTGAPSRPSKLPLRSRRRGRFRSKGLSLEDIGRLSQARIAHFTAILVNAYRYEMLLKLIGGRGKKRICAIKMSLHSRIIRRIRRQPRGSTVLLVLADDDAPRVERPGSRVLAGRGGREGPRGHNGYQQDPGPRRRRTKRQVQPGPCHLSRLGSGARKGETTRNVIRGDNEMNMESLEKTRVQAGVIV